MSRGRGRASPSRPDTPRGRGRGRGRGTGIRRSASVGSVKGEQLSEDGDRDGQQQQAGSDGDEAGNSNDENEDRSNDDEEDSQEDEESSEDSGEDEKDPDAMNYRDDAEDSPRKKKGKQAKHQGKGGRPGRPAKQGGNAAAGGKRRGRPPANDKGKDRERDRDREQPRQGDNAGNAAGAAASGSGSAAAGGGGAAPSTDLHALDDAVGMAGVDLNAEEEAIRASNYGPRGQQARDGQGNITNNQQGNTSNRNRQKVRPQIIVDEQAIKDAVLRIAAQYQLRNLESDSLPLIGLAVQMRVRTLLEAMIEAKQHRVSGHHMRPPPMHPARYEGDLPAPMWDTVMYDDVDKIVSTFDRLEREEERQARKDRLARDQAEQEERERLERLAREAAENGEEFIMPPIGAAAAAAGVGAGGLGDVSMGDSTTGTPGPGGAGSSIPGTPLSASIGPGGILDLKGKGRDTGTGTGNAKEKKRKRETPAQQARNMSDDVRKRLSDQTAQRKLGGKKFSWLSGGSGPGSSSSDSPLGKKARPKFPPLPPSNLSISTSFPGTPGLDGLLPGGVKTDGATPLPTPGPGALGRLTSIPNIHEASRSTEDPANKVITIRDALFVMENERGMGAGVGSGTKSMMRAYMGRT